MSSYQFVTDVKPNKDFDLLEEFKKDQQRKPEPMFDMPHLNIKQYGKPTTAPPPPPYAPNPENFEATFGYPNPWEEEIPEVKVYFPTHRPLTFREWFIANSIELYHDNKEFFDACFRINHAEMLYMKFLEEFNQKHAIL